MKRSRFPVQLRGVGVNQNPIVFTKAILCNVFIQGVLARKPSEKRTLKKKIYLRLTPRANINHSVVSNEGDCAERLGLTLQLPNKTIWWHEQDAASSRTKVIPNFFASLAASAAEKVL